MSMSTSSLPAKAAPASASRRTHSTMARMDGASSRSIARRSMKSGWKRSFSATKWTPFPALCATGAASSTMQTAARCIWTASAICRRSSSGSCCAFCRNTPSLPSAAARCTSSIRESSPRPTAPRTSWYKAGSCGRIFFTGSTRWKFTCRACARGVPIFRFFVAILSAAAPRSAISACASAA